ncbi:MAG: acyl carrier protein [Ardenticatenaceae bacterium]|nr:acyl carrier protein [Ardenticatenaceae bacterium]
MNTSTLIERFVIEELMLGGRKGKIDPDESLIRSGILDSLSLLRLIVYLEEQFGLTVEDSEVIPGNFETLNSMEVFVKSKMGAH